ncbi:hypothetical protein [Cardinium endosymbiont of Tipula unca]|uniref:hypothetical protein n=1 Tax=Cardinium endosymbiont of Tipula unca TaxID=3066216 RepID=UPI0030CBB285
MKPIVTLLSDFFNFRRRSNKQYPFTCVAENTLIRPKLILLKDKKCIYCAISSDFSIQALVQITA